MQLKYIRAILEESDQPSDRRDTRGMTNRDKWAK